MIAVRERLINENFILACRHEGNDRSAI